MLQCANEARLGRNGLSSFTKILLPKSDLTCILQTDESVLARAEKPSALRRSFKVEYNNKHYLLEAASAFGRRFVLRKRVVGSVGPEHVFTKKTVIDLPPAIALPVKVFLTWLTIILWKREASAAT